MADIYKILKNTTVEGPGVRFCIWVQGCKKALRRLLGKRYMEIRMWNKIQRRRTIFSNKITAANRGVTFLGGEPFEQAKELAELARLIKEEGLSVLCFTGYILEELRAKNDRHVNKLLDNIDLLIDGGFEQKNYDLSRPWVGSSNQRYIFLTDFYSADILKKYKTKSKCEFHLTVRLKSTVWVILRR